MDKNGLFNVNKAHVIINTDNGRTLGLNKNPEIMHANVVSGREEFTVLVRLIGGQDTKVEASFLAFKNEERSYRIRGAGDTVSNAFYWTGSKGCINEAFMVYWLKEKRSITPLPKGKRLVLFLDNCSRQIRTSNMIEMFKKDQRDCCLYFS